MTIRNSLGAIALATGLMFIPTASYAGGKILHEIAACPVEILTKIFSHGHGHHAAAPAKAAPAKAAPAPKKPMK